MKPGAGKVRSTQLYGIGNYSESSVILIDNWTGFTTLMGLLSEYERNFPELLHKAFLFNSEKKLYFKCK